MTKLRASATIRIDISGQLTNIEAVSVSMRAKHNSIMHKTNGIHAMLVGYIGNTDKHRVSLDRLG